MLDLENRPLAETFLNKFYSCLETILFVLEKRNIVLFHFDLRNLARINRLN